MSACRDGVTPGMLADDDKDAEEAGSDGAEEGGGEGTDGQGMGDQDDEPPRKRRATRAASKADKTAQGGNFFEGLL